MSRWLPRVDICRWGGGDIDGENDVNGWSICLQWGPMILELCGGKVER